MNIICWKSYMLQLFLHLISKDDIIINKFKHFSQNHHFKLLFFFCFYAIGISTASEMVICFWKDTQIHLKVLFFYFIYLFIFIYLFCWFNIYKSWRNINIEDLNWNFFLPRVKELIKESVFCWKNKLFNLFITKYSFEGFAPFNSLWQFIHIDDDGGKALETIV